MEFSASKGKKPVRAPRSGKHSQPSTSGQSASHSETAAGPQPSTSGQSASHSETAAGPQPSTSGQSASHSETAAGPQPSTSGQSASHSETAAGPQPSTSGQSASHSATATRTGVIKSQVSKLVTARLPAASVAQKLGHGSQAERTGRVKPNIPTCRKERQPSAATLPATSSLYPVLARRPQSNEPVLSRVREGHYERKQGRQAEDPATVQQKARLAVLRKGGNPDDRTQLLGQHVLQFGKFQGESFHWLLENTLGWVANLVANMEQAQEKPVGSNISKNNFLLREYCLLFAEGREAVQMKQGAQQASSQCTPLRDPQRNPAPHAPQAAPTPPRAPQVVPTPPRAPQVAPTPPRAPQVIPTPPRAPQAAPTPPPTSSTDFSAISEAELVEAVEMAERQLAVGEVTFGSLHHWSYL